MTEALKPTQEAPATLLDELDDVLGMALSYELPASFRDRIWKVRSRLSGVAAPAGASDERFEQAIFQVENKLRGIPQAHIAAQVIAELRAALSGAPAVAVAEPLTEDDIKRMRSEARADPRCLDQHWFVLLVRAVERHYGIGAPAAKENGSPS